MTSAVRNALLNSIPEMQFNDKNMHAVGHRNYV